MVTQERVRELFDYDGCNLVRISGARGRAKNGDIAGCNSYGGYLVVNIDKKRYYAHRIIHLHQFGFMPEFMDHKNMNKLDNRLCNIRACTKQENQRNHGISKANTSGVKGVFWREDIKKWSGSVRNNGKTIYTGVFKNIEDAKHAVMMKRKEFHGKFCNHGDKK